MATLPPKDLQDAIARTISDHEKAYEVAEMCTYFGLSKERTYDPWQSKRL